MKKIACLFLILALGACGDDADDKSSATTAIVEAAGALTASGTVYCQCATDTAGPICTDINEMLTCFATMSECLETIDVPPSSWQPTSCEQEAYALDEAGVVAYATCVKGVAQAAEACFAAVEGCDITGLQDCLSQFDYDETCDGLPDVVDQAVENCGSTDGPRTR